MSSPPLFSTSADPELQPPSIQLPLSQVPAEPPQSPPPPQTASPNEPAGSLTPVPLPEPDSDDDEASAPPITLSASVVLTNIPRDSRVALTNAFTPSTNKVTIRFLSIGSAPSLKKKVFTVTASKKFSFVVRFLRNNLGLDRPLPSTSPSNSGHLNTSSNPNGQSLFVYVNSTFAPSLDAEVGNLYNCFKSENQLVLNYCLTPAFG
ncbi:Ubiquitin-like protein [Arthrobotrys musiformis]|uniref:Ubiquitin-like protein ATG12 n=1 Tax=Arthrobotrys musiformis TaxID=47236 RepID=A0AAV9WH26_9PEZI